MKLLLVLDICNLIVAIIGATLSEGNWVWLALLTTDIRILYNYIKD